MIEQIVILIGPPGAGKGYYGAWMIREKNFIKFSSGDIARKYAEMDSQLGVEICTIINDGNLIPAKIISEILFREISLKNSISKIIIDGFPRNLKQEKIFLREYKNKKWKGKPIVLFLDITEKISNERILGRLTCTVCGQPYHIKFKPPINPGKCNFDNAQLIKRSDEFNNKKRLEVFKEETQPLINYMSQSNNYNFIRIDCTKSNKKVYKILDEIFK